MTKICLHVDIDMYLIIVIKSAIICLCVVALNKWFG